MNVLPAPVCMHDLVEDFPPNAQLAFNREELRVGGVDQDAGNRIITILLLVITIIIIIIIIIIRWVRLTGTLELAV